MPKLAAGAEKFLGLPPQAWADAATPLLGTTINAYEPLATRVDPAAVKALLGASAESLKPSGVPEAARHDGRQRLRQRRPRRQPAKRRREG